MANVSNSVIVPNFSNDELIELNKLAHESNPVVGSLVLPRLKINYSEVTKIPKGVWVVNQKIDPDGITVINEGEIVDKFVMLKIKNRYVLFDEKNPANNCRSPYHNDFEVVHGNRWGYRCGRECQFRSENSVLQCKFHKVVFGIAITKNNNKVNCMMVIKGSSFMPFVDFLKTATEIVINGKQYYLPIYAFVTLLGKTEEKSNKGRIYYVPTFARGELFKMQTIKKFAEEAAKLDAFVDQLNEISIVEETNDEDDVNAAVAVGSNASNFNKQAVQQFNTSQYGSTSIDPHTIINVDSLFE